MVGVRGENGAWALGKGLLWRLEDNISILNLLYPYC